jgi:4-hydroxy-tetrahydrodipicolinate reductase
MRHEARDRRVFADGALRAAIWLKGRKGVFTMRDVLGFSGGAPAEERR